MTVQANTPSALTTLLDTAPKDSTHPADHRNLALQIQHNLQYQHQWTDLRLHTHSPLTNAPLPRPLLSGLPPKRLYVHPDELIELIKSRKAQGQSQSLLDLPPEREWVLPSHLQEKWSLRRMAEVFDGISVLPPRQSEDNKWRTLKRVVLATLDDDSTVVYYIVHDGLVKPRQN